MRHLKQTAKLGRTGEHRNAMLANLVCSLIKHRRVATTLAKARAARPAVRILFNEIAPTQKERRGGYTRIVKLGQRQGDAAQLAILEWVDVPYSAPEAAAETKSDAAAKAEKKEKSEDKGKDEHK